MNDNLTGDNRWCFDKDILRNTMLLGKEKLLSRKLSSRLRQIIKIDIKILDYFLNDNYDIDDASYYILSIPNDMDKLRDYILIRMEKQYKTLGDEFIRFIIDMSNTYLFDDGIISFVGNSKLSMDERMELTIKNYERNSHKFLGIAKKILLDRDVGQIQVASGYGSYCHRDSISHKQFIVIDESSESSVLNHEVEHAIEMYLGYSNNILYDELGSILYEMLFNEVLYDSKGFLDNYNFDFRLNETRLLLDEIAIYFEIMLYFVTRNFNISTNEFVSTFMKYMNRDLDATCDYLRERIASDSIVNSMKYLFSFLKAVELREKYIMNKEAGFFLFEHYLKSKKFNFKLPQDGFCVYDRYVNEMVEKTRKRIKPI